MDETPKSVDKPALSTSASSSESNKLPLQKMVALALLLSVPVMMTGCGNNYDDDEDDEGYYGGGGYIYSSGSNKNNSGYSSSNSSSSNSSYKGFGSSGKSSVGG